MFSGRGQSAVAPKGTEVSRVDKAASIRERILEEACRLFAEKGFSATSIRDISHAAGVTNPMIYYYFGSKEELFLAVISEANQAVEEGLGVLSATDRPFEALLVDVIMLYFGLIRESPDTARLFLYLQYGPERFRFEDALKALHDKSKSIWAVLLGRAVARGDVRVVDVEMAMLQIFGLIHMPMLMFLSGEAISLDEETARKLVSQLMDGIRPDKHEGAEEA